MTLTYNDIMTILHGLILGSVFLLAFAGGMSGLWGLRKASLTDDGLLNRIHRLKIGLSIMAVMCWLTVLSGTYFVYPSYRAKVPESPRSQLLANPDTAFWHSFGMEWKEHVAWLAPILATTVAAMVFVYGRELAERNDLRRALFVMFILSFVAAAVPGLLGAFLNKVAPVL